MGRDAMRTQGGFALKTAGSCVSKHIGATEHWKSTYRGTTAESAQRERLVSTRPLWSINRQAYSSSRGTYKTEFQETFGKQGHNPRNILNKESTKQSNAVNELTMGTQKITQHIPGYSGFLPQTDINENAFKQSVGDNMRTTFIKQNIVENFHVKIPGYQGHKTMSVVNDRGSTRPYCLSKEGESFNA